MVQRHPLSKLPQAATSSRGRRLCRQGLAGLLALSTVFASSAAMAAPFRCANEEHQKMFELSALKTELMVVATTCDTEDAYNAFIRRYQSDLSRNDMAVIQHFTGRDRRAGQRANDAFVTNLANARAQEANRVGADYCARNARLFREVMALPSAAELAPYAASKDLLPATLGSCVASASAPATPARTTTQARANSTRTAR
ncbi:hypothetical protein [Pseudoroseomonas cervicalis]|uniref:hypothetical protein n=1 Tax=Teichococcus cervicalis TaxID=204525 RepID=UPI0022F1ABA8|nr:hypothetical protein [Pseudoroseomonas cervicalis]WBV43423.1 hypothetical protein PFY06_02280 [Pseudoroseomonas cervicalis]